jgi:hypothetical protein
MVPFDRITDAIGEIESQFPRTSPYDELTEHPGPRLWLTFRTARPNFVTSKSREDVIEIA